MALTILQEPRWRQLPANNEIIFAVADTNAVALKYKVKYLIEIYCFQNTSSIFNSANYVTTLKVIPNSAASGIVDLSPIIKNYVSPDYMGGYRTKTSTGGASAFKQALWTPDGQGRHEIHVIDNYTTGKNIGTYFALKFKIQYADSSTGVPQIDTGQTVSTDIYYAWNGVIQEDVPVYRGTGSEYGYDLQHLGYVMSLQSLHADGSPYTTKRFLSNMPLTQYATENCYGVWAFFNCMSDWDNWRTGESPDYNVRKVKWIFYNSSGSVLNTRTVGTNSSNGGNHGYYTNAAYKVFYAGVFPANIKGDGYTIPSTTSYYTVECLDSDDATISQVYTIHLETDDCKGYEKIRLAWLNTLGTWDYYNFKKKSVRSVSSTKLRYTQIKGDWNSETYTFDGHHGGNKVYNTVSSESIDLNTDFISEEEGAWLQELFISNDVYMIKPYDSDYYRIGNTGKYVEPVVVKTSEYVKQTKANDKLIQYSLEIERTKKIRTATI